MIHILLIYMLHCCNCAEYFQDWRCNSTSVRHTTADSCYRTTRQLLAGSTTGCCARYKPLQASAGEASASPSHVGSPFSAEPHWAGAAAFAHTIQPKSKLRGSLNIVLLLGPPARLPV
jgi:hypothetical protein